MLASQSMEECVLLCDRVAVLSDGKLRCVGKRARQVKFLPIIAIFN